MFNVKQAEFLLILVISLVLHVSSNFEITKLIWIQISNSPSVIHDEVAEWLRRWTANPLGSPRVGSNPILVDHFTH